MKILSFSINLDRSINSEFIRESQVKFAKFNAPKAIKNWCSNISFHSLTKWANLDYCNSFTLFPQIFDTDYMYILHPIQTRVQGRPEIFRFQFFKRDELIPNIEKNSRMNSLTFGPISWIAGLDKFTNIKLEWFLLSVS